MNFQRFLSWIPGWLGFALLILVGLLMAIHGLFNPLGTAMSHADRVGFSVFGIMGITLGTFSWIVGGTSKIEGREGVVGVKVSFHDMPWWAWIVDLGQVAVALSLFFILK